MATDLTEPSITQTGRVNSVDRLRGIVMLLMALDHVREFWAITPFDPANVEETTPAWFLTRWITHLCAPIFILLAGTSAWFSGRRRGRGELSVYLLTRGLMLVAIELVVIVPCWLWGYDMLFLAVIAVIGISMVLLAGLIWLPWQLQLLIAMAAIFGHNAFDGLSGADMAIPESVWNLLHVQGVVVMIADRPLISAYPIVPWFSVMLTGYLTGPLFGLPRAQRRRILVTAGITMLVLFALLRVGRVYGDVFVWQHVEGDPTQTMLSFLRVTKYPPSLQYLLVTLGPGALLLAALESGNNIASRFVEVFGRVPLFFYVLHLPLIHLGAEIYQQFRFGRSVNLFSDPETFPESYEPSLLLAYLVTIVIIAILYWPCVWYGALRGRFRILSWL